MYTKALCYFLITKPEYVLHRNVTILERSGRVGGKSNEVNLLGVANTMSTYLFTEDYKQTVVELAQRFGLYDGVIWTPGYRLGNSSATPFFSGLEFTLLGDFRANIEEANRYCFPSNPFHDVINYIDNFRIDWLFHLTNMTFTDTLISIGNYLETTWVN